MVLIDIIIKAPNQRHEDQTIKGELEWTVHQLKSHLSSVYPTKPRIEDQRLIYSGHLLRNEQSLNDVLQPIDDNLTFTIHMVCAQSSNGSPKRTSLPMATNSNPNNSSNNGNNSSSQPSESTRTNANTGVQYPTNGQFMSNFNTINPNLLNMGLTNPSIVIPPDQMWQQMAVLQQAYAQYMAQYMTQNPYLNQTVMNNQIPPTVPPMVIPQTVVNGGANDGVQAPNAAPVVQPQPPVQRLNAGPGQQVIDDDEEQRNRDWLDYFFWMSRAVVLFSIIYFYSSFTRFILVVFLSLLLYLYQTNWFNNRQQQQNNNNLQQNIANNNNNNENAVNREEQDRNEAADDTEVLDRVRQIPANNSEVTDGRVTEDRFTGLRFFWVFVTSLFTSLIPDNPAVPVNIN